MTTEYNAAVLAAGAMPARIAALPVTDTGYPVPWFAAWIDGKPDLRVLDTPKFAVAWRRRFCWTCGQPLGRTVAASMGPMCAINRITGEPPSHRECIEWAMRACPFLSNPKMRRNEAGLPEHRHIPGFHVDRNPGVMAMWLCRDYRPVPTHAGGSGYVWSYGEPSEVHWFTRGRPATRAEVEAAMREGTPALFKLANEQGAEAVRELMRYIERARSVLPRAEAA